MKWIAPLSLLVVAVAGSPLEKRAQPQGIDVSDHQPNINWGQVKANGVEFAYIKATEGITFISPPFNFQRGGATSVDLIRGAYHFARPEQSPGSAQANFFIGNGGGWIADGRTLPGVLHLEAGPNGHPCYGLNPGSMDLWIRDFSNTYRSRTGRFPVIYTTTSWWQQCTGNNPTFASTNPLWIAAPANPGALPAGWGFYTFLQHAADSGPNPGQDVFNGDSAGLRRFAASP
ncbi:glycoside hydrolase family 25 protein [Pluteus cervinus]|uniref:Glycoside hydrolase family 25 protein n=1 Tax=Pluteus cervinus TaxID=181527 RepID=A0ACD3B3Q5_9AGAR|nr:glycoside hydrolase family 25 protein [Pluteus cervinus]